MHRLVEQWPDDANALKEVSVLCFAAAGPVRDGEIRMTNAPITITGSEALLFFPKAKFWAINDFEAQAWACLAPYGATFESLHGRDISGVLREMSRKKHKRPLAVIGAGTGLGAAWLIPGTERRNIPFVLPSEAGHVPFSFEKGWEQDFASFLCDRFRCAQPSAEQVLSGKGLALLHEYTVGGQHAPEVFTAEVGFADSECCRLYARFMGRFCRMASFFILPCAIVLTGGVLGRTPCLALHPEFLHEFLKPNGISGGILEKMPVALNTNMQSGLWGAAFAAALLNKHARRETS